MTPFVLALSQNDGTSCCIIVSNKCTCVFLVISQVCTFAYICSKAMHAYLLIISKQCICVLITFHALNLDMFVLFVFSNNYTCHCTIASNIWISCSSFAILIYNYFNIIKCIIRLRVFYVGSTHASDYGKYMHNRSQHVNVIWVSDFRRILENVITHAVAGGAPVLGHRWLCVKMNRPFPTSNWQFYNILLKVLFDG